MNEKNLVDLIIVTLVKCTVKDSNNMLEIIDNINKSMLSENCV